MMLKEDIQKMVAEEEKHLGVGSKDFMSRHNEIMEMADQISRKNKESASGGTAIPAEARNPLTQQKGFVRSIALLQAGCKEQK